MRRFAWVLLLLPQIAAAQEWQSLDGAAIDAALNEQTLVFDAATQHFYASGRTLYDTGQESWGYWAVRGDQYCSQWPPGDGWECYDMARAGIVIRFIAKDGSVSDGRLGR